MPQSLIVNRARLIFPALLAWVAGAALQLQQAELFALPIYGVLLLCALTLLVTMAIKNIAFKTQLVVAVTAFALSGFGSTGLRATIFLNQALDPALQGRDIAVTGLIAARPQRSEAGLRLRLEVESAQREGQPVQLPPQVHPGWYSGCRSAGEWGEGLRRAPAAVEAGARGRARNEP